MDAVTDRPDDRLPCVFVYDDSFEGLLTAVFESYAYRPPPVGIVGQQHQQELGVRYVSIDTDQAKADRVIAGIRRTIGGDAYERVWTGYLSAKPDKGTIICRYIRLGMQVGAKLRLHLTDPRVAAMNELAQRVGRESSQLIEFVRFSRMEGGVYYAEITPEHDVLPLMMPFFIDRFNAQPFLIHDTGRHVAAVYDTQSWYLTSTEGMTVPDYAEDERRYRQLWKRFYDTIAIKERLNPSLPRQHMPKKFWRNITELAMADNLPKTPLPSDISRERALEAAKPQSLPVLEE